MTVLGIIAAVAAVALRDPVRAYADANRRAELTDIADTALRRIARDIRLALPNSIRVSDSGTELELLLTKTGGRYREQQTGGGDGDVLEFHQPDNAFDTLGPVNNIPASIQSGDILVVYNLNAHANITSANAYTFGSGHCSTQNSPDCNTAQINGTGNGALANETRINFAARQFPHASPGNRFHIIEPDAVSYVCAPGGLNAEGDATGTLKRVSGYGIQLTQPTGSFGVPALLANNVAACSITYNPFVLMQSLGLVAISLTLTKGGESVTLYHEVHVTNIP